MTTKMPRRAKHGLQLSTGPIKVHTHTHTLRHSDRFVGRQSQVVRTYIYRYIYISYGHGLGLIVWEYLDFHCVSISVTGRRAPSDRLSAASVVDKTKSPFPHGLYHIAAQTGRPVDAVNVNGHRVHRFSHSSMWLYWPEGLPVEFHTKITLFRGGKRGNVRCGLANYDVSVGCVPHGVCATRPLSRLNKVNTNYVATSKSAKREPKPSSSSPSSASSLVSVSVPPSPGPQINKTQSTGERTTQNELAPYDKCSHALCTLTWLIHSFLQL